MEKKDETRSNISSKVFQDIIECLPEACLLTDEDENILETESESSILEQAFEWQKALVEGSRDAIFISNKEANFVAVNEAAQELTGYSREELLDMRIPDLHEETDLYAFEKYHERIMDGEEVLCETRILRKDGDKVDVELNNNRITLGGVPYLHTTARDVSRRQQLSKVLKEERDKLKELHNFAHEIHESEEKNEACEVAAEAAEETLGLESCRVFIYDGDSLVQRASSVESSRVDREKFSLDKKLAFQVFNEGEIYWGNTDDMPEIELESQYHKSVISIPLGDLGIFQTVSEARDSYSEEDLRFAKLLVEHLRETLGRLELEKELREQSIRDPLTDLYNRRYFNETLKKEIERSKRNGYTDGFLMIDVNRFKEINDRYSHQKGDEVLKAVANLLRENVRSTDTVVRYGGDEFLIMLVEADHGVEVSAERLQKAVKKWNEKSSLLDFPLTLAIGVSRWSADQNRDVEDALKEADEKMYENKRS
ncbi:diguanylate cyclase [Candidatus Bipolaricaulota bacterium]|nr:diguanylate cyclase [Candidatus Bipolaricaulota bacterium]